MHAKICLTIGLISYAEKIEAWTLWFKSTDHGVKYIF